MILHIWNHSLTWSISYL